MAQRIATKPPVGVEAAYPVLPPCWGPHPTVKSTRLIARLPGKWIPKGVASDVRRSSSMKRLGGDGAWSSERVNGKPRNLKKAPLLGAPDVVG